MVDLLRLIQLDVRKCVRPVTHAITQSHFLAIFPTNELDRRGIEGRTAVYSRGDTLIRISAGQWTRASRLACSYCRAWTWITGPKAPLVTRCRRTCGRRAWKPQVEFPQGARHSGAALKGGLGCCFRVALHSLTFSPTSDRYLFSCCGSAKRASEWVTGGSGCRGQSGEPTHAHLHYWQ